MSDDCLFCRIVDGELPSRTVHETESAVAFLDVNPLSAGHTLVVPRAHHERVAELPAGVAGGLFRAVATVTPAVEAAVDAPASTVAINNGEAAGQEVPHVHVHVVPRYHGDGAGSIHGLFAEFADLEEAEMDAIGAEIRGAL
jgi:histidine triad (HIT) family protein